jgi:hypothetical protein
MSHFYNSGTLVMQQKGVIIPKEEQLSSLAQGNTQVYKMLKKYVGDLNKAGDLRLYITITETELADYLRSQPELMEKHLYKQGSPRYHEDMILEYNGTKYLVYQMDHDDPWNIQEFEDFSEATAHYLISNLGI